MPSKSASRQTRSPPDSICRRTVSAVFSGREGGVLWLVLLIGIIAQKQCLSQVLLLYNLTSGGGGEQSLSGSNFVEIWRKSFSELWRTPLAPPPVFLPPAHAG